jgi:gliding motility-associated protein GldM
MVDEGLNSANKSLDASNAAKPESIKESAKKKASLAVYADKVDPVRDLSKAGSDYIDRLVAKLVDESGDRNGQVDDGDYVMVKDKRELKGKKNYDATTRLMVDSLYGQNLKETMLDYKEKFLSYVDEEDRAKIAAELPIAIDEESWKNSPNPKKNWSDFTFGHMPLGATMPIFTKFKNDIKSSETAILNYLASKVGLTKEVVLDKFRVVSAPEKSYIIKGEKFAADVFLSAAAGADSNTGISISVNGQKLRTDKDGVARFEQTANALGKKKYEAVARITNPVTGETDTYKQTFEYEVGERSVAVSATKMNVFYMGVDNPVSITAAGVPSNQVKASMSGSGGGSISPSGGNYVVRVSGPPTQKGQFAKVNVSAPGLNESREFRVKRIPKPVAKLGNIDDSTIGNGTFKAQAGIIPVLENFDFDARCDIQGFTLTHVPKRQDAVQAINRGGRYSGDVARLVNKAKPGDVYYFDNVKAKCPGWKAGQKINSLVFKIK